MRTWMFRIGLTLAITASFSQTSSPVSAAPAEKDPRIGEVMAQLVQRYADCIGKQADVLEKSGEAAPAVASAAVSACRTWRDKTQQIIMLDGMVNYGLKVEQAGQVAEKILKEVDADGKEHVLLKIIQVRAQNAASPQ
jgi:hypothetical protein